MRAIRILKESDLIIAEDTRTSGQLLQHLGISKKMYAHHQHNEHKAVPELIKMLKGGTQIAMISDAGTPGISDPGFLLVRACIEQQIEIDTLPGPTALIPALINSGLPADRFSFEGFLPLKKGRKTRLAELSFEARTLILYESPHRLTKTLSDLEVVFGPDRRASVSRELSKLYQENRRGTLGELKTHFIATPPKGELVICIAGNL